MILAVPGPLLDVKVIPYSVLILITWKEIIYNGGSSILNITISYRAIDNTVSNNNWKIISVDPFKVTQFCIKKLFKMFTLCFIVIIIRFKKKFIH